MNMKNKINIKKRMIILIIPLLILLLYMGKTYGLFETNLNFEDDLDVAKWAIKVNGDVVTDSVTTFDITNLETDSDSNVLEGKFAPASVAYFDIEIDPNDTEVAFRYDVNLDFSKLDNDMIRVVSIDSNEGLTLTRTDENTYSTIMSLSDIEDGRIDTIRVSFKWVNDEANNEIDYQTQLNGGGVTIPVEIKFEQYLGEPMVEYTE